MAKHVLINRDPVNKEDGPKILEILSKTAVEMNITLAELFILRAQADLLLGDIKGYGSLVRPYTDEEVLGMLLNLKRLGYLDSELEPSGDALARLVLIELQFQKMSEEDGWSRAS